MFSLKDKVALITGASQGIGRATALTLVESGAKVAVAARNAEKLASLVSEIEAGGGVALAVPMDVADAAPNAEAGLAREQQGAQLRRAVRSLPLLYRQVVTLMLEGMEYDEMAQVLGISASNVGARLSRARQMLRELMEVPR